MAEPIAEFFRRLHGEEAFGHLIVWTRQDKATRAFDLAAAGALTAAMEYCRRRAETCDVYAAVGLQASPPAGNGRGTEDGVCSVPAVWADIDIAGPAHASKDLPATEQDAVALIEAVGLPPSIIVRSGFGLQVYWRYKEPWRLETAADRAAAKSLSTRFQGLLRQLAQSRGWGLDSTPDLCRVLRVPGTFNRKLPPDIRSVTAEYSDSAYTQADIEEILAGIEDPGPLLPRAEPQESLPPAKLPLILEGCPWMQHCRDDARNLPGPEWYRLITVVARCEDAERWAHELSKAYPRYSRRETAAKLRQASRDNVAPVTCAYVQSDLGGEKFCAECLFRGNVNSPIAIGRIETEAIHWSRPLRSRRCPICPVIRSPPAAILPEIRHRNRNRRSAPPPRKSNGLRILAMRNVMPPSTASGCATAKSGPAGTPGMACGGGRMKSSKSTTWEPPSSAASIPSRKGFQMRRSGRPSSPI